MARAPASPALVAALALLAQAATASAELQDPIETQAGVRFACTGVGLDAREDPRWQTFPLRLEFAAAHGGYIAGVATEIRRADGSVALQVRCDTPWLVVDLPPGRYSIATTALDRHSRSVTVELVPGRQTRAVIRYPEIVAR